ncbi:flagellar motor stator protein MotA [Sandaracinobacteroides saxicola]|uniref:Flagellar motor stator protein MotA n=2 Tax=Sandaracinobacteroides saxicola TaxID=2759707 RepID=A0A7G5IMC6_9SPHN|nr:flagellar motor stator protein MotA [Sandaracinobacteroides saxicola]
MLAAVGLVVVLAAVFGTFVVAGGNFTIISYALPYEMATIMGAAIGAFVIANKTKILKGAGKGIMQALKGAQWKPGDYRELLVFLYVIAARMRSGGAAALEADVEDPNASSLFKAFPRILADRDMVDFVCDYVRMAGIEKIEGQHLDTATERDLERRHHDHAQPQHALQVMADGLPAIGIVAAVLGVIKTMGSIDQPTEVLGAMIGGALVGTFLGVLLSYCVVGPLASRLGQVLDDDAKPLSVARTVLLLAFDSVAPEVSVEIGRRQVPVYAAPSFTELEVACKEKRSLVTARGAA